MTTIGTATIPDPLIPSYEQLSVEVGRLRAELAAKDALIKEAQRQFEKIANDDAGEEAYGYTDPGLALNRCQQIARAFLAKLKEQNP